MSQNIAIGKSNKNNRNNRTNRMPISQSIPVQWYAKYIPPQAPQIRPVSISTTDKPHKLPEFELPPSLPDNKGVTSLPQFSLTNDRHPMSMPVRFIKPKKVQPFKPNDKSSNNIEDNKSDKQSVTSDETNQSSLNDEVHKLTVGSFTCLQLMTGNRAPLTTIQDKPLKNNIHKSSLDTKQTNLSINNNNNNNTNNNEDENSESEEQEGIFELEDEEDDEEED